MSDVRELVGKWHVRVLQWTWEYTFFDTGLVQWKDINSNERGSGRRIKTNAIINIHWHGSSTKETWPLPINRYKQRVWYEASYARGNFEAVRMESFELGALDYDYSVGPVPLIKQESSALCWAAGAAMMIAWKIGNPNMTTKQAVQSMGEPFITIYNDKNGLTYDNYIAYYNKTVPDLPPPTETEMVNHYVTAARMRAEPLRSYTPRQLYELLARCRSPLLVQRYWAPKWTHMCVITRISGSGTPMDTLIEYNDPKENKPITDENFEDFSIKMSTRLDQISVQVLHY
jgi:Papain-like cysteine protease AvrRpt2